MIHIIITSYKEPKATEKAIQSLLDQNIKDAEIIVSDPFPEVIDYQKSKFGNKITYDLDFGEGKSAALNRLFKQLKGDIIISTDGDVYTESEIFNTYNGPLYWDGKFSSFEDMLNKRNIANSINYAVTDRNPVVPDDYEPSPG